LLDWLHVVDLGVAADFWGNLFKMLLPKYDGGSDSQRCRSLFLDIQRYYREAKPDSQLDNLNPRMIWAVGKPPKLRGKGAEIRHLVPFAASAARRLLDDAQPMEQAAKAAAGMLAVCYDMLNSERFEAGQLANASRRLALLLVALERRAAPPDWRIKPKLHLLQELAEIDASCPSTCWLYRDEDFGGSVAQLSRRRGGANRPHTTSLCVLRKFCAKHRLPAIL
jgi:hypothetical protein